MRMTSIHPPNPPNSHDLVDTVLDQNWHLLPMIPERYKVPTPRGNPRGDLTDTTDREPKGKKEKEDKDKQDKEKTALVQNPKASTVGIAALQESGKKITDIQTHAPLTTSKGRDGNFVPVCLSWNLWGSCFTNCKREKLHRKLTVQEQTDMAALVATHLANE